MISFEPDCPALSQPTQRVDDFTIIVYPFIEAQNGFSRPLTDAQWLILGKTLRQVHKIAVPSSIHSRYDERHIHLNGERLFGRSIPILELNRLAMKLH